MRYLRVSGELGKAGPARPTPDLSRIIDLHLREPMLRVGTLVAVAASASRSARFARIDESFEKEAHAFARLLPPAALRLAGLEIRR